MKKQFVVEQKALLSVLAAMQPICTKRTTIDATTSILFQVSHRELILKSTDLEISLQVSTAIQESSFTEEESFLVPGKRIFDVVKELEGSITFSLFESQLIITAGQVHLALNIKAAQEFPPFPERIENLMCLEAGLVAKLLDSVAFLIPQNNANPALNGLLVEISDADLKMTATDGHCLVQVSSPKYMLAENKTWLLPRRAVFELKKLLEGYQDPSVFLGVCGNQIVFSGVSFNFFSKLLGDKFPHYQTILDKSSFVAATIDRARFTKTLRRSSSLLSGQFLATKFGFSPHKLRVSMINKEVGKLDEELPLGGFDAQDIDIRFYAPYLLSGLQAFTQDSLTFFLRNSSKPIIFESDSDDVRMTYLVMPVLPTAA